jgi:hypothetical protein
MPSSLFEQVMYGEFVRFFSVLNIVGYFNEDEDYYEEAHRSDVDSDNWTDTGDRVDNNELIFSSPSMPGRVMIALRDSSFYLGRGCTGRYVKIPPYLQSVLSYRLYDELSAEKYLKRSLEISIDSDYDGQKTDICLDTLALFEETCGEEVEKIVTFYVPVFAFLLEEEFEEGKDDYGDEFLEDYESFTPLCNPDESIAVFSVKYGELTGYPQFWLTDFYLQLFEDVCSGVGGLPLVLIELIFGYSPHYGTTFSPAMMWSSPNKTPQIAKVALTLDTYSNGMLQSFLNGDVATIPLGINPLLKKLLQGARKHCTLC